MFPYSRTRQPVRPRGGARRARLQVEVLEGRAVPAILVNTLADNIQPLDGLTSLREAILQANSDPDPDTIVFADALAGGTIFLAGTQLPSNKFAVREQATRELKALAEHAVPALRAALTGQPSLESRRLEALLHQLDSASLSAETVRQIRAVEALECIGNPAARRLLAQLAAGPAATHLTQEAQASLGRLARRTTPVP
jgi:hypothetical protein